MNYFRCTVGGSGGKLKLTVTCTNVFAGLTITCTDGTTTLTKTCPSASPYTVVFNIPNGGTWTISGVYGGKTNTTTVVIPDTATLNYIPTGSTATPTNDIQTWLHCANIWNKNYTTINQVLADTSTLLALISSNNAADYMARSTNWASSVCANQTAMGYIGNNNYCANKLLADSTWRNAICNSTYFESVLSTKIPTMTSNTTPSGTASASAYYGSDFPWKAFDGNDSTRYQLAYTQGQIGSYLRYDFETPMRVYLFKAYSQDLGVAGSVVIEVIGIKTDDSEVSIGEYTLSNSGVNFNQTYNSNSVLFKAVKYRLKSTTQYYQMTVNTAQCYGRT